MNKLVLLCVVLCLQAFSNSIYCQNSISKEVILSPLTVAMITKNYTPQEIDEIKLNVTKLKLLEFYFSKSFEIVPGQNYTNEQVLKIDVLSYNLTRKLDESVTVFDTASGLNIILYSFNAIEQGKKLIDPSTQTFSETQSKTNN